jgi:hypothetical protein
MSGRKTRHLYNNVCQLPGSAAVTVPTSLIPSGRITVRSRRTHYLEIGSYTGSTCVSAAYKTNVRVTCVDNYSEFTADGARDIMFSNIEASLSKTTELTVSASTATGMSSANAWCESPGRTEIE